MKHIKNKILFFMSLMFSSVYAGPFGKMDPSKIVGETGGFFKKIGFWLNLKDMIIKWAVILLIIVIAIILAIVIFKKLRKQK